MTKPAERPAPVEREAREADEDLGNAIIRTLADAGRLVEIRPGVYALPKRLSRPPKPGKTDPPLDPGLA